MFMHLKLAQFTSCELLKANKLLERNNKISVINLPVSLISNQKFDCLVTSPVVGAKSSGCRLVEVATETCPDVDQADPRTTRVA